MASRNHQRSQGVIGVSAIQKRFVPKSQNASNSSNSGSSASFTASLRENLRKREGAPSTKAVDSRIDGGSSSLSGSGHEETRIGISEKQPSFVNYLPQDEAVAIGLSAEDGGIDAVESQKVVDLLNDQLSRFLKMRPRQFWKDVASASSLESSLDSFLQFRSRWYDFPHHGSKGVVAGVIVGELELSRRVFMLFYRLSSNKDPGAHSGDSLSAKEHAALLQERKLLDLPKLLDICAIYGRDNEELTRSLVSNALKSQPWLVKNLVDVASHFLTIVHTMHQRCSSLLEALFAAGSDERNGHSQLHEDFLEVMDFINDAISTLDAFVDAYKPAAAFFADRVETRYGNDELLSTLARLHDSLLPSLEQGFALISTTNEHKTKNSSSGVAPNVSLCLKLLSIRIVNFGWKLLDFCYLNQSCSDDGLLSHSSKIFPIKFEDAGIRGDIIVQIMRELSMGISYDLQEHNGRETFIQGMERGYKMLSRIEALRKDGWFFLDDEQWKSLQLLAVRNHSELGEKSSVKSTHPISKQFETDEERVILESKISQIKDIFPDYGKGFLSACLEVYNQDPEEVIQRILEGTLHEDLKSLDVSLEVIPQPKTGMNDKGKGILEEPISTSSSVNMEIAGRNDQRSSSSSSSHGRFMRKQKSDSIDSSYLDEKGDKDSIRSVVLASYEYEDEYDDSFDDLGLTVVESGFEETEVLGDEVNAVPDKPRPTDIRNTGKTLNPRWGQRKTQFYVKDGKNYSYKVAGAIAVSDVREAALVNQSQKETIHGLGRGGNIPLGAVKALMDADDHGQMSDTAETGAGANSSSRGRGRGRRGGSNHHHQKDRSMKKHFSGLNGY